jgi:hypothetical protein
MFVVKQEQKLILYVLNFPGQGNVLNTLSPRYLEISAQIII